MSNKTNEDKVPIIIAAILILFILILAGIASCLFSYSSRKSILENSINEYIASLKNGECEFLNVPENLKIDIINSIIYNENFKIEPDIKSFEYASQSEEVTVIVNITTPSLPYSIFKLYPQLFTHTNNTFLLSQLNNKSPDEYIEYVCATIANDLRASKDIHKDVFKIVIVKNENNDWVINESSQLDNFVLGNIFSCQNNDVSFLTFRDLIYPSGENNIKTSSNGVSTIFASTSSEITYSSPEIPIPLGETARYNEKLQESDIEKSDISFSVFSAEPTDDGGVAITIKIKNNNPEQEEKIVLAKSFGLYKSGQIIDCGTGEDIIITSEPQIYKINFTKQSDILVFSLLNNNIYLSLT